MHITSLPSKYGVGTMGREAREFVDFLHEAKQSCWEILPLGHTGCGDSPYQCFSAFAGNPYLIDLGCLARNGLLTREEIESRDWGGDPERVDYGKLWENRFAVLRLAARRGLPRDAGAVNAFALENSHWLPDYALFMALKMHFGGASWTQWPDGVRLREPAELEKYRKMLREDVDFFTWVQYKFFRQWKSLRAYAHSKGVKIIGDVPIYVPLDSADVWACPENFQLDGDRRPRCVAGVPPDYFSADGQLWGNPLYDWQKMKKDGYSWWLSRLAAAGKLYDVIRFDHFRGLDSYWSVPAGEKTAVNGRWVEGPGSHFIFAVKTAFPKLKLIAEDLGFLTESVRSLRRSSGFPGMKVLQFAFDAGGDSYYLPHRHWVDSVCFTGTHDNATLAQFIDEMPEKDFDFMVKYLGLNEREGYIWGILRAGMTSVCQTFVAQMQDYLELGAASRMNTPGTVGANWRWRVKPGALTPELAERIAAMTVMFGRVPDRAEREQPAEPVKK
ncbi:MAG: 4-alpha-glucanotransferase [Butyricicoccus sp.]|nr:4-alpha-glucanotransferase [Butyricicoccus sp.]